MSCSPLALPCQGGGHTERHQSSLNWGPGGPIRSTFSWKNLFCSRVETSLEGKKTESKVLQSFKKVSVGKELLLDSL